MKIATRQSLLALKQAEMTKKLFEEHNIESRPLWKPMHCQPVFQGYEIIGGTVAESLFAQGLCLPSDTNIGEDEKKRILTVFKALNLT